MFAQFRERWQKLNKLDRQQRKLFWRSLLLLRGANMLLHLFRYQDLYGRLKRLTPLEKGELGEQSAVEVTKMAEIVELAARRRLSNATCLRRSLVLWYLLRREGIDSDLRLGIRKESGRFEGHAWVEIDGSVINDDLDVTQQYAVMDLEKKS